MMLRKETENSKVLSLSKGFYTNLEKCYKWVDHTSHDFKNFTWDIQTNCFWSAHALNWFGGWPYNGCSLFWAPKHKCFYNSPWLFDNVCYEYAKKHGVRSRFEYTFPFHEKDIILFEIFRIYVFKKVHHWHIVKSFFLFCSFKQTQTAPFCWQI